MAPIAVMLMVTKCVSAILVKRGFMTRRAIVDKMLVREFALRRSKN